MTITNKPPRVDLALFSGYADGECWRCGNTYEIVAFAPFVDADQWTCPACAEREFAGMEQIIKGLDLIHETVLWDVLSRPVTRTDVAVITASLRELADMIDKIMDDQVKVKLAIHIQDGVLEHEKGQPIGVLISRDVSAVSTALPAEGVS